MGAGWILAVVIEFWPRGDWVVGVGGRVCLRIFEIDPLNYLYLVDMMGVCANRPQIGMRPT